ncbi:GGDEF domain-containing protein [Ruegeria marina]|uniref:Diguanylate cyclase (GGDEF) domain-containing protein n=1 Tax=Ruegeria marina TaxID=639004 RepID=A0A1G6VEN1_9RHOB|nr:GGDEF domain-containing protein [Ruegeria marina]SDD51296.1 diguanylate cyclase (GGDEF) domain-containing protein [Ruegeria marina]
MTGPGDLVTLLDRLCPMFALLDSDGRISRVGPTLQKLRPQTSFEGTAFLETFELLRPRSIVGVPELMACSGAKLHLRFRDAPRTALKGLIVPLPGNQGAVVNLSFGISILDAVRDYALTAADFAGTDLAIELLYLVETKSAAMEASRKLNLQLQGAKIAAEEQAFTDTLTGLKNRRAMDHVLKRLLTGATPFALMHLDLDYFKSVNDTLGHAAGDHVLQQVARIMVEETRGHDTIARIGGDEFVLVFNFLQDRERLDSIARRLIDRLEEPIDYNGEACRVSASIGTVLSSQFAAPEASKLLHAADLALYAAKRDGRATHRFYSRDLCLPQDDAQMRRGGGGAGTQPAGSVRLSANGPDIGGKKAP